jgi:hypothetical protein
MPAAEEEAGHVTIDAEVAEYVLTPAVGQQRGDSAWCYADFRPPDARRCPRGINDGI